jgi:hypothetical protein
LKAILRLFRVFYAMGRPISGPKGPEKASK